MQPQGRSGDYVLKNDLEDWITAHSGETVRVEAQALDEIDWEEF
jgi:hypothetical protein